jgi:hypothetical protein
MDDDPPSLAEVAGTLAGVRDHGVGWGECGCSLGRPLFWALCGGGELASRTMVPGAHPCRSPFAHVDTHSCCCYNCPKVCIPDGAWVAGRGGLYPVSDGGSATRP